MFSRIFFRKCTKLNVALSRSKLNVAVLNNINIIS